MMLFLTAAVVVATPDCVAHRGDYRSCIDDEGCAFAEVEGTLVGASPPEEDPQGYCITWSEVPLDVNVTSCTEFAMVFMEEAGRKSVVKAVAKQVGILPLLQRRSLQFSTISCASPMVMDDTWQELFDKLNNGTGAEEAPAEDVPTSNATSTEDVVDV
mmetsp:Transcript_47183/g.102707  ORF Transcript_47183/g.102707 Transcript_47183/m.102707 type:complete len:158 (-) Transcript_47183:31-504(-)